MSVCITTTPHSHIQLSTFFRMENNLCFCHNADSLKQELCKPDSYKKIGDCSSLIQEKSPKAFLLHNGNRLSHTKNMTEHYETMKILLSSVQYQKHNRKICGDLKIMSLSLQTGCTKQCVFCLRNSIADVKHDIRKD